MEDNKLKLIQENRKLNRLVSQYEQVSGITSYIDDSTIRGGYQIVGSIQERNEIDCCHKKIGMVVSVKDTSVPEGYSNYRLIGTNPCYGTWIKVDSNGVAGPPGPEGPQGPQGEVGEISLITFDVNDDMHLIMQLETNTNLNFILDDNGHLVLIN